MEDLSSIFIRNFFLYDWVIFVAAGVTGVVFWRTWGKAKALESEFFPRIVKTGLKESERNISNVLEVSREKRDELTKKREEARVLYSFFEKLSSIFPMLGILGTVWSLLQIVRGGSTEQSFFVALTSTLWGIVFAILSKGFDVKLSALMESNHDAVDLYMDDSRSAILKNHHEK